MNGKTSQKRPDAQAGNPDEAKGIGAAVGVLRSIEEAPVMRVERRRGAPPSVRGGLWPKAPKGDTPLRREVTDPDCDRGRKAEVDSDPEGPIRETRSSGLMSGGGAGGDDDNDGLQPLTIPSAYSTHA